MGNSKIITENKGKGVKDNTPWYEQELNINQRQFCKNYTSIEFLGSGVHAYANAYGCDLEKKGQYAVASVGAGRLLKKPEILKYIDELLDGNGLNDHTVDKHLLFLIQQGADLSAKLGAIREFNKLRNRVTDKLEVKQEVTHKFDYSKLSDEELETLIKLSEKAKQ